MMLVTAIFTEPSGWGLKLQGRNIQELVTEIRNNFARHSDGTWGAVRINGIPVDALHGPYRLCDGFDHLEDHDPRNRQIHDMAMLIRRLVHRLHSLAPDSTIQLRDQAMGYLKRHGLEGSPLRSVDSDTLPESATALH